MSSGRYITDSNPHNRQYIALSTKTKYIKLFVIFQKYLLAKMRIWMIWIF